MINVLDKCLPRRLTDSGEQTFVCELTETNTAQLNLADKISGPATIQAPPYFPGRELRRLC